MTTDMSALLRFTDSDCLIDIFRLFFRLTNITIFYDWSPVIFTHIVTNGAGTGNCPGAQKFITRFSGVPVIH